MDKELILYRSLVEFASSDDVKKEGKQKKLTDFEKIDKNALNQKLEYCQSNNIEIITYEDRSYPKVLSEIPDSPAVLYCRGDEKLLNEKCLIAMVGSRRATSYGLSVAKSFSSKVAQAGAIVVSGLALGIDGACHRGTLETGGKTIAVLGTAIDKLYPLANESLGKKIISSKGLIISEYPPGYPTYKTNFPMRNRIIAGLAQAVVVIEAAENSGALITATLALEYNRDLYAVPGDIGKTTSRGTNKLLSRGAICLCDPSIIIEDFNLASEKIFIKLPKYEQNIIDAIRSGADSFDKIINKLKIKPNELNVLIGRLEIKGVIKKTADVIRTFD